ncbi:acyl-CoA dehydrogenase family protein [Janibacter limosus]|uniref:Uncharacterized protein n=1 Tax=Janibacter limosus TaxID=53458 RepID=A0AC61U5J5_9MICO|nr:acyl-CoA dehydrogenase family protein [Janibacter limosus]UUZ45259.1 acyl-CoA dehydrogenase family protein [Janibacter limosus]
MSTEALTAADLRDLTAMVHEVLADASPAESVDDASTAARVWAALDAVGVTVLGLDEERGGSGADPVAATDVLRVIGEHTAPGPLAETSLLGGWLLELAGLDQPDGPVSTGPSDVQAEREGDARHVTGTVDRVPVLPDDGVATTVVALAQTPDGLGVVQLPELGVRTQVEGVSVIPGHNLAGERRDQITIDLRLTHLSPVPDTARTELELRGALSRAALAAGALRRTRDLSLRYAGERVQFGRPIGAFRAVQQQLATLVAETAAASAVVEAAVRRVATEGFGTPASELAVALAAVRTAEASTTAATIAHRVHGAMGVTQEHPLRHATTRLWSRRSEWGSQSRWAELIADRAVTATGAGLWPLLTGVDTP